MGCCFRKDGKFNFYTFLRIALVYFKGRDCVLFMFMSPALLSCFDTKLLKRAWIHQSNHLSGYFHQFLWGLLHTSVLWLLVSVLCTCLTWYFWCPSSSLLPDTVLCTLSSSCMFFTWNILSIPLFFPPLWLCSSPWQLLFFNDQIAPSLASRCPFRLSSILFQGPW